MAKYTFRRKDTAQDPSKERALPLTLVRVTTRVAAFNGPYIVRDDKNRSVERPTVSGVRKAVSHFIKTGAKSVMIRTAGVASFLVKEVPEPDWSPIPTPGTAPIDKIYGYVHGKYPNVRDMGICVNKPGEHGHCNAWDGGAPIAGWSSNQIHAFIETIAEDLKRQGQLHDQTHGAEGLPVNGVIVMERYWETGNSTWRPYTGVAHVSHFHVSGKPSITGWV